LASLTKIATLAPEPGKRCRKLQSRDRMRRRFQTPLDRRAQIGVLHLQSVQPRDLVGAHELGLGPSNQRKKEIEMPIPYSLGVPRSHQTLPSVLPNSLEAAIPPLAARVVLHVDQRFVDKMREEVQNALLLGAVARAHLFGRIQRPATRKHR